MKTTSTSNKLKWLTTIIFCIYIVVATVGWILDKLGQAVRIIGTVMQFNFKKAKYMTKDLFRV